MTYNSSRGSYAAVFAVTGFDAAFPLLVPPNNEDRAPVWLDAKEGKGKSDHEARAGKEDKGRHHSGCSRLPDAQNCRHHAITARHEWPRDLADAIGELGQSDRAATELDREYFRRMRPEVAMNPPSKNNAPTIRNTRNNGTEPTKSLWKERSQPERNGDAMPIPSKLTAGLPADPMGRRAKPVRPSTPAKTA